MSNTYTIRNSVSAIIIIFSIFIVGGAFAQTSDFARAINHRGFNLNRTSIAVANAESGKKIAGHSPDLSLNPASCAKIITAATALAMFGPDYRIPTGFFADEHPRGGTIGTLYVRGMGDPMMTNETIEAMAAGLYSKGVRRITGGVVVDNSYFDSYEYPRKMTGAGRSYTAKTAATAVNFNSVEIEVGPGARAGGPAAAGTIPPLDYFKIVNKLVTGGKFRANMSMNAGNGGEEITVSGRVPLKFTSQKFYRSVLNPAAYAAAVIQYWLKYAGVDARGPVREGRLPAGAVKIASFSSPPLALLVAEMNKASNNFMAEQLLKHIGAAKFGAPGSTSKGVMAVEAYLASIGIPRGTYTFENGSGLSEVTRVSADQLVRVLVASYNDPRTRRALMDSFSVLGVDGTTKKWRFAPDLTGKVYVKTGTINGVSTLAGYAPTADGKMAAFAILANGLPRGVWSAHEAELGVVRAISLK